MFDLPLLVIVPTLAFAGAVLGVGLRIGWREARTCLLVFALSAGVEWWSILQSRSSTAAIGFLFLPAFAAIVGLLGVGFVAMRRLGTRSARTASAVTGALALLAIAFELLGGIQTVRRNHMRDAAVAAAAAAETHSSNPSR